MGVLRGAGMEQGAAGSGRGGCSPRAGGTAVPGWGAQGERKLHPLLPLTYFLGFLESKGEVQAPP